MPEKELKDKVESLRESIAELTGEVVFANDEKGTEELIENFNDYVDSLIKTKLLCFGDIIERWYNLVDKNKILVYNYNNDIKNNQQSFLDNITKILKIDYDKSVPPQIKVFVTKDKPTLTCNNNLMERLNYQMNKFKEITKL